MNCDFLRYFEVSQKIDKRQDASYALVVDYKDRITIEPGKRGGKPSIRGLRITVYDVVGYLASGMTEDKIFEGFPGSYREDIRAACIAFAADQEESVEFYDHYPR